LDEIIRKQNLLKDYAVKMDFSFRKHYSKISYLEGIVSRGDQKSRGILFIMLGLKVVVLMVGMKLLNTIHGLNVLKNLELILSMMLGTIPMKSRLTLGSY
jgi:hypothetical protein